MSDQNTKSPRTLIEAAENAVARRMTVREVPRSDCFCCAASKVGGGGRITFDGMWIAGAVCGSTRELPLCSRHLDMFAGAAQAGRFTKLGEQS